MRVTEHKEYQSYQNKYWQADQNGHTAGNADKQAVGSTVQQGTEDRNGAETTAGAKADAETAAEPKAGGTDAGKGSETLPAYLQEARSMESGQANDLIEQLRKRAEAFKRSYQRYRSQTLYSSTSDLMAIANTESEDALRSIYVRLSFKLWSVRAAGATGTDRKTVMGATRSIEKVIGKVKGKIKGLQKEEEMEKKAKAAKKAKQHRLEQEIRRELTIRRRIRKNKERKDIADSYLESDGQYSVKNYRDSLPDQVLAEMEMQASGGSGIVAVDTGMSVDEAIAGADSAMGVDIMTAVAEVSGSVVDVAL